jgi:hypothetical protein
MIDLLFTTVFILIQNLKYKIRISIFTYLRPKDKGVLKNVLLPTVVEPFFFKTIVSTYKIQRKGCFKNVLPPTVVGPFFFKTIVSAYKIQRKGCFKNVLPPTVVGPFFF